MGRRARLDGGGRTRAVAAMILATLLVAACGTTVEPYASAGLAKGERPRMAILPFENLSKAPGAAKTLEGMVLVELLKRAPISIVDPGEVAAALSKERVRIATSMSRETLIAVARELRVELVLMGTLHDYDMQTGTGAGGSSQIPALAVTLRVVDARFGDIVWAANAARRGTDHETVFGVGRIYSLNTLAERTAADMGDAFAASMRDVRPRKADRTSVAAARESQTNAAPTDAAPPRAPPPPAPPADRAAEAAPTNPAAPAAASASDTPAEPPAAAAPAAAAPTEVPAASAAASDAAAVNVVTTSLAPAEAAPSKAAAADTSGANAAPAHAESSSKE